MFRRLLLGGGGVAAATAGGGALYVSSLGDTERAGVNRAYKLYSQALPVVAHYRLVQAKHRLLPPADEAARALDWAALDERYADRMVGLVSELKGLYVKYGQLAAGLDMFSEMWREKLRTLEDAVPPQPIEVVRRTVADELRVADLAEVFCEFDEEPIGSASIGQVHRARLRTSGGGRGEEVAVKVQYPDSRALFRADMISIRGFLEVAAPEQVIILNELERSVAREFDYTLEAESLAAVKSDLAFMSHEVRVPRPIRATPRVLIMEYLPGRKLLDGVRAYATVLAAREGRSLDEFEAEVRERLLHEGLPARYDGPSAAAIAWYVRAARWRDAALNAGVWLANAVGGLGLAYRKSAVPPNAPRIMDVLMRAHGHQLLVTGRFQADPHAGNFLWLSNDDRIGLIDFGATKTLEKGERLAACLLYAALHREDKAMVMRLVRVGGYRSKHFDEDVIYDLCRFGFDTFGRDLLGDENVQTFMDDLYRRDPWYESADNLTMAQFLSIRLRTVGLGMLFPVKCSEYWGPIALKALEDEGMPYDAWTDDHMRDLFGDQVSLSKGAVWT